MKLIPYHNLLWIGCLIIIFCQLCGCSNPDRRKNEQLREEIIQVHDEAMEKIGYMYQLELFLTEHQNEASDESMATESIAALQKANREMFSWMHEYQLLAVGKNLRDDNEYRLVERQKIGDVAQLIDNAINQAESLKEGIIGKGD